MSAPGLGRMAHDTAGPALLDHQHPTFERKPVRSIVGPRDRSGTKAFCHGAPRMRPVTGAKAPPTTSPTDAAATWLTASPRSWRTASTT